MESTTADLKNLKPGHDFFIGIDSDGCVFDTMEIKHKECFCPELIDHFNLHPISEYVKETWEFVNLYSRTRGVNRFSGFIRTMEMLEERDDIDAEGIKIPELKSIREWIAREPKPGNPSLKKAVEETKNGELTRLYNWSHDVNKSIGRIVRNVPPFSFVEQNLEKISRQADIVVISSANQESLNREWSENGLKKYVGFIAGQESGKKKDCFQQAVKGKYSSHKTLMIGDAPGDLKAAKDNNALYFPIIPGREESSWKLLLNEGLDRFFNGSYAGEYEEGLIEEFFKFLPESPAWESR